MRRDHHQPHGHQRSSRRNDSNNNNNGASKHVNIRHDGDGDDDDHCDAHRDVPSIVAAAATRPTTNISTSAADRTGDKRVTATGNVPTEATVEALNLIEQIVLRPVDVSTATRQGEQHEGRSQRFVGGFPDGRLRIVAAEATAARASGTPETSHVLNAPTATTPATTQRGAPATTTTGIAKTTTTTQTKTTRGKTTITTNSTIHQPTIPITRTPPPPPPTRAATATTSVNNDGRDDDDDAAHHIGSIKSKSSENKCSSVTAKKVSNERLTAACRPTGPGDGKNSPQLSDPPNEASATSATETKETASKDYPIAKDYNRQDNTDKDIAPKGYTLQEKKDKLKETFFKDFLRGAHKTSARRSNSSKLKLWIPPGVCPSQPHIDGPLCGTTHSVDSPALAEPLVLRRKRQLEQRLRSAKRSPPPTRHRPRPKSTVVPQLVKIFDRSKGDRANMIVHNSSKEQRATVEMSSLKPSAGDEGGLIEQRNSPLSDEGCTLGLSPYSSDNEDGESMPVYRSKRKDKVGRSASSDSALGLDIDDPMENPGPHSAGRRMTLTVTDLPLRPALLPLAEPTALLDSPPGETLHSSLLVQTAVPSKVLLEERVIGIPEAVQCVSPPSTAAGLMSTGLASLSSSRRESSQSCGSDGYLPNECAAGVRFVRTPSVVVSDYSDDLLCGITLEEIEYFRAQRQRRRRSSLDTAGTEKDADGHSDVSASSSCSNLYYCGSTISALDGAECLMNGIRTPLERKTSDCSSCGGDETEPSTAATFTIPEQPEDAAQLADMLAAQHLGGSGGGGGGGTGSLRRIKKVGLMLPSPLERPDL